MEALTTETVGRYTVETHYDPDPSSPRDWDNVGRIAGLSRWTFNDDAGDYRDVRRDAGEPILAIPVTVLDGPYTLVQETDWDGADGIYWAPLSKVQAEQFDGPAGLRACLAAELSTLNDYLAGRVYGFTVIGPYGTEEDSCWGYVGEEAYALEEGRSIAEWATYRDACVWAELPEWVRQSVLIRTDSAYDPDTDIAAQESTCSACGQSLLRYGSDGIWFGNNLGGGYGCPQASTPGGLHVPDGA